MYMYFEWHLYDSVQMWRKPESSTEYTELHMRIRLIKWDKLQDKMLLSVG